MKRRLHIAFGTVAVLAALLGPSAPALAATDQTTAVVSCSPSSVTSGKATTCTVTITDPATTPVSTPAGTVIFTSSPNTGDFGAAGNTCTLAGSGASASCQVTFTPSSGGSYTIKAAYGGDPDHTGSSGTDTVGAVDPTTTTLACTPTTVQIGTSTNCTATLTDTLSKQPPINEIDFTSAPATGSFGTPSSCLWQPSGTGGSATCQITFTPTNPGGYTLTATYVGDDTHTASHGTSKLTATTTPANGGPGTHGGGGSVSVTIGSTNGPPPPGQVTVARRGKVVHKHANVLLSCAGTAGSSCTGALALTTKAKVKVKVKTFVKVKVRSHKKGKGKGKTQIRFKPKIKTKRVTKTIQVGVVGFGLAAGSSRTVSLQVSKAAMRLLTKKRGRLRTQALVDGAVVHAVALGGKHHKHHKKHKKHKRHSHGGHAKKKKH